MKRLTAIQSRVLALGVLFIMLALFYGVLVHPIMSQYMEKNEEIASLWDRIEKYQRVAVTFDEIEGYHQQVERKMPAQGYYLKGDSSALASANLQNYLSRVIARFGGKLISTQNIREEQNGLTTAVIMRVHMKGDTRSLLNTIYKLETAKPMLFFNNLVVVRTPQRQTRNKDKPEAKQLDIQFNLVGYMLEKSV